MAASSAAGALDFIVVDTTATAQRCVELLRRHSLGVATFLILEKQQHLAKKMNEHAVPPEGELQPLATALVHRQARGSITLPLVLVSRSTRSPNIMSKYRLPWSS